MTVRHLLPDALLIAASLLAGAGWIFSVHSIAGLPPLFFVGTRFLLAGVLIGAFGGFRSCRMADVRAIFPAAVALALSMMTWITGLRLSSNPGVASFITACGNLVVPMIGLILYRWPMGRRIWLSLAVALAGLGFLFLEGGARFDMTNLWFVVASCCWAMGIVLARNGSERASVITVSTLQLTLSGIVILVASASLETWPTTLPALPILGWFLASVLLSTCLRFLFQLQALQMTSTGRASVLMCLEPVWALIMSMAWLGTSLSISQAIGCAVIFSAILFQVGGGRATA